MIIDEIDGVMEFLKESNAIEGVYDDGSLKQAFIAWDYLMSEEKITVGVMLKTHKILMLNQSHLHPNEKGYLRKIPIYIAGREGVSWKTIPTRLATCALNMNLHPDNWREHHIEFEKIHPFVDGNGRTGRMFMNWERLKAGLPLLIIHEGKEQMEYYKWFK